MFTNKNGTINDQSHFFLEIIYKQNNFHIWFIKKQYFLYFYIILTSMLHVTIFDYHNFFLKNWSLHIYVPVKYINILVSDIDAWSKLKYQYFVAKHILQIMTWGKKIRWYFCKYWKKKSKASEIKETLIFHNILQLGPSFLSYWQITGC